MLKKVLIGVTRSKKGSKKRSLKRVLKKVLKKGVTQKSAQKSTQTNWPVKKCSKEGVTFKKANDLCNFTLPTPPPRTFLQLSPPERDFWAHRKWTYLPGPFRFHMKNRSAGQLRQGGGAYFWTKANQVFIVCVIQLVIISGQGHISKFVVICLVSKGGLHVVGNRI